MEKIKVFLKKEWYLLAAFIIPWLIAIVYAMVHGIWITGEGSMLTGDTLIQLTPFCYELWDKVHSGDSFFYTWNVAGGCDFTAISGYFVSPFTILLMLVPRDCIPYMMQFVMICKWACASCTMTYFFFHTKHNTLQGYKKVVSLFLGLAFCLSNGMVNFITYIQFGDVMICFPIILLLIEKLVEEKSWKVYCILLAFCMMSNSYIAYEMCLFLIIWFFMQFSMSTKQKFKKFLLFAGSSTLSAVIVFWGLLVGIKVSQDRLMVADTDYINYYARSILLDFKTFAKQFFIFEHIASPIEIQPNVYCSIMITVVMGLFFAIKISKKRKIYMDVVMLLFIGSIFVGVLSLVWHLFSVPNGVYHRFINYFIFMMLFMALYVLIHLRDIKIYHVGIEAVVLIAVAVYTFLSLEDYDFPAKYIITILLLCFYLLLMFFFAKGSIKYKNMILLVAVLGMIELCANTFYTFEQYCAYDEFKEGRGYYYAERLCRKVVLNDGERLAGYFPATNVNLLVGKPSDSGFVSSANGRMMYLYERLGMAYSGQVEYTTKGASPLIDLMLNIRYRLSKNVTDVGEGELVEKEKDYSLYRNDQLAGLGYMVNSDILTWDIDKDNCFKVQNTFLEKAVKGSTIFIEEQPEIRCSNTSDTEVKPLEEYRELGSYVYDLNITNGDDRDSLKLNFEVDADENLFCYFCGTASLNVVVLIDDEVIGADSMNFEQGTYHIGNVKKGQKISIYVIPNKNKVTKGKDAHILFRFASFDKDAFAQSYAKLSKNVYNIDTMESDYVKGTIHADEDGIMMTSIQAVDGFTVYVDGKETEYNTIGYALIGVPLTKGNHTVEFRYRTPYLAEGLYVSAAGLILYVMLCVVSYIRTKKKKKESENLQLVQE